MDHTLTTLVCICGLTAMAASVGCSRVHKTSAPISSVESTVRIDTDDGKVIEKKIVGQGTDFFDQMQGVISGATGQYLFSTTVRQEDDAVESRIRGRIENGKLQGIARQYVVIDGKEILADETDFVDDVKEGVYRAYFPMTKRVRINGSFHCGQREGDFVVYYQDGSLAAKAQYRQGQLDGHCVIYDRSGQTIADGHYERGTMESGTFLKDPKFFLWQAARDRPSPVDVVTIPPHSKQEEIVPNQASLPTTTAVTPPAGAGDRASGARGSP